VTGEEIAAAVDELESKLERLRVLYDQFFVGIEKIPPNVLQKDVDRRIWVLRREKIRNTGIRFKFQTIIQRYNTFSSYWVRILREIENGTYKRDVLRAKRRFGADPNKPREAARLSSMPPPPEPAEELDVELSLDDDADLDQLAREAEAAIVARPPMITPLRTAPPLPGKAPPPPPKPATPQPAKAPEPSVVAQRPIARPSLPRPSLNPEAVPKILAKKVESDDDLDDMLDQALGTAPAPKPAPAAKPQPMVRPSNPNPFARPAPAAAAPKPQPAPAAKPAGAEEYRKVYAQYVEAKRKNGESTAGITYETLAKSLEQTKEKLKGKSGGKAIDFEVAVKDGKTILKPVVR
jgi:hypothetical protein